MSIFTIAAILIGLSALFGYINHLYLKLPHTIGLVVWPLVMKTNISFSRSVSLSNPAYPSGGGPCDWAN